MLASGLFDVFATPYAWFYQITHNYILSIVGMAAIVMAITAPLILKSTKGMLEMQRLQPEMRRLQQQHRGDRQKLNEEMMKLYQEHKVNPLASCFPLLLQLPVFFIMFRVLTGLSRRYDGADPIVRGGVSIVKGAFNPNYVGESTKLFQSLVGKTEMLSWGFDLASTPAGKIKDGIGVGWPYALLVVALGGLYLVQQRQVAARATTAPNMSATQQKIMQYLPVVFAVFLVFYITGLVIYYMAQAIIRIGLQNYITHRFYKGDESLGRQAMAAGERAREIAKADKDAKGGAAGGGIFAQAKRDAQAKREAQAKAASERTTTVSKRVTPPKGKPTGSNRAGGSRPQSSGRMARPDSRNQQKKK